MSKRRSDRRRPLFKAQGTAVLSCIPGNHGRPDGEPATIITLVVTATGVVEPIVIGLDDTRRLAVRLLTPFWTADDDFAGRVLDQMFSSDDQGSVGWPQDRDDR